MINKNILNYYNNKIIIVTGAYSGIGKALYNKIIKYKPKVLILADINFQILKQISQSYNDNGYKTEAYKVDVSKKK